MATRKLGIRRTMTPNQIVAYNVAKARAIRGWTQEQAAEAIAPYLGARLSGASFSALERSAWKVERIKQFDADELLALSRGFDLPIGFFFTPPPPDFDAGLHAPDAGLKGLDPIVLLDAILGRPDNLEHWERELLAYSANQAPAPRSKREKPSVSPSDLAERLEPLGTLRAQGPPASGLRRGRRCKRRPGTTRRSAAAPGRGGIKRHLGRAGTSRHDGESSFRQRHPATKGQGMNGDRTERSA